MGCFGALPHLRHQGPSLFPKDAMGTLGRERGQVDSHTFDSPTAHHVNNGLHIDMPKVSVLGLDVSLALQIQDGQAVRCVSNAGRG